MPLPKNKGPLLYKSYVYGEASRNVCVVKPQSVNDRPFTTGYLRTGSATDRLERTTNQPLITQRRADIFVKSQDVARGLVEAEKHWKISKKLMVKMEEFSSQLKSVPTGIVDGLESIQKSVQEGLTNLSIRSMDSVISELPRNVEISAWVKPIEQLSAEATQQISIIQGMVAEFRFEETGLSKVFSTLRDKLTQGIQALIGFVNKCEAKIIECVNFLRSKVKVLSGKWSQLLEVMPRFSRMLSRMSGAIEFFFKAVIKEVPGLGQVIDLWGAAEASNEYLEHPHDKKIKRKYIVAVLGFIVGVIVAIIGMFAVFVGVPAAVVGVPVAILAAGSIYLEEDPIAKGLYALFPEKMTEVVEKVESMLVWLGTLPTVIGGWVDTAREGFDQFLLGARDLARSVGELKEDFINSDTGRRLGDFMLDNLP